MGREIANVWREIPNEMRPKIRYWVPAAAVDEDDLREELRALKARGFGGVEVVSLASIPQEFAEGEEAWGKERWLRMMEVIDDEAQKLGISVDYAIGPGWPIASPEIKSADDPAALRELTWGELTVPAGSRYEGALPRRRTVREEGEAELIHVLAYREAGDHVLDEDSYMDLSQNICGDTLTVNFPEGGGNYKVFAFYSQPACQKITGVTYAIDHLSAAGAKAQERFWDRIFERGDFPAMESLFCDSLEYQSLMDWTPGFIGEFESRRGYSPLPYLPVFGSTGFYPAWDIPGYRFADESLSARVNNDYAETLTQCYCENHLKELSDYAESHGKTVRYQVAYNKFFEEERCGLYVGIPENEALGRALLDGQRLMAASAHLGRKPRYSFECAAEFGHSYGQDYEDLFWWVKRSLMAGMNAQVLHGGSYSGKYTGSLSDGGKVPGTAWPGYDAFGGFVSNNWNRTLCVPHARGCLDAVARLNTVFRKTARVDLAVYRQSYKNDGLGNDFEYYPDGGKLANLGYSYEFLSDALLAHPNAKVCDRILDRDGAAYRALIIPWQEMVPTSMLMHTMVFLEGGLPVIWQGEEPKIPSYFSDSLSAEKLANWERVKKELFSHKNLTRVDSLSEVPAALKTLGILPRVAIDGKSDAMTAFREDGEKIYAAVYAYNRIGYDPNLPAGASTMYTAGTVKPGYTRPGESSGRALRVRIEGVGRVSVLNPWDGTAEPADFEEENGSMAGTVRIEEDEMVLLELDRLSPPKEVRKPRCGRNLPIKLDSLTLYPFGPLEGEDYSFLRSGISGEGIHVPDAKLVPWHRIDKKYLTFAGKGVYVFSAMLDEVIEDARYILDLGNVSDTFSVKVNGVPAPFPDQVMKRADLSGLLKKGENEVEVTVYSNLHNRFSAEDREIYGMQIKGSPRDYGIWEGEGKKLALKLIY